MLSISADSPQTPITVSRASENDRAEWDSYLFQKGILHHAYLWAWRDILKNAFGHKPVYFAARNGEGRVCGVLPLIHFKSPLFGTALISMPYLNAGGIAADDPATAESLLSAARAAAEELNVQYVELRYRQPIDGQLSPETAAGLAVKSHKVSMTLDLPDDPEKMFSSFPPKLRSQIRRPTKSGAYAEVSTNTLPLDQSLAAFYTVFSEHMRDLGTPVYPKRLFSEALRQFNLYRMQLDSPSDTVALGSRQAIRTRVITVWHNRRPIAAGITIGHGSYVEIPWASALRRFNQLSPNMLLYWQVIKTAIEDGYRQFDFGRSSPDSGTFKFKQQWGASPLPLHWYYSVIRGEIPDVNPSSSRFSLMSNIWKRLPVPIANVVGPLITKGIP